jgi:hypothetical protein
VHEAGLFLMRMARSEFPICEIVFQPCHVNALRLDGTQETVARVCRLEFADLVRRVTALISGLFRDPFPRVYPSAIRDNSVYAIRFSPE